MMARTATIWRRVVDVATTLRAHRDWLGWCCAACALMFYVAAAYVFRSEPLHALTEAVETTESSVILVGVSPRVESDDVSAAAGLALIGAILTGAALLLVRRAPTLPRLIPPTADNRQRIRVMWPALVGGLVALWLVAEANSYWLDLPPLRHMSGHRQFALLVMGWGLVVIAFAGVRRVRFRLPRLTRDTVRRITRRPDRGELVLLALITGLALGLRLWQLGDSIRAFVDELNFAATVRFFWTPRDQELLVPMTAVVAFPRLFAYWEMFTVELLGRNLAGLRAVSALLGTLTVPALYVLARTLAGRTTALIAAALLAALPPHLHYSRLALNNIADPFFGTLALALLARGLRDGRQLDFALAGAALGLTQYFYEGGRIVFPALIAGWLVLGTLLWHQRPPLRGVAILALVAVCTAAPVYYVLMTQDLPLAARTNAMIHDSDYWHALLVAEPDSPAFKEHLARVRDTFLIYVHRQEGSFYYGGTSPLVLIYAVPALLAGAGFALWRLRTPGGMLPLLWVLAVSLGNSFMVLNTQSPRYVTVFPALALLMAMGVHAMFDLLWPVRPRSSADQTAPRRARWWIAHPALRGGLLALIVGGLAAVQIVYYFGPHLDEFNRRHRLVKAHPDGEDALFRAQDFPPGTTIYLISDPPYQEFYAYDVLMFLRDDLTVRTLTPDEILPSLLWSLPRDVDHAFFVARGDDATRDRLAEYFVLTGPHLTAHDVPPERQYVLYYAPANEQQRLIPAIEEHVP